MAVSENGGYREGPMKTKRCPDCGQPVSRAAPSCPHCGRHRGAAACGCGCLLIVLGLLAVIAVAAFF